MDNNIKINTTKDLLKELAQYNFVQKEVIPVSDISKYKNSEDKYVFSNASLCTFDEYTNTRILLGIFKCVNTIKNILITGMVLGVAGIILNLFVNK